MVAHITYRHINRCRCGAAAEVKEWSCGCLTVDLRSPGSCAECAQFTERRQYHNPTCPPGSPQE